MTEEEIIKNILDEAFNIHRTVGPGMLEKVYQNCLAYRLRQRGLFVEEEKPIPVVFETIRMDCGYRADIVVEEEKPIPVVFETIRMDCGYRADIVVEGKVIVDTKNVEAIADIHVASMLTYLKFPELRYGLILNFRTVLLKDGIKRVVRGY